MKRVHAPVGMIEYVAITVSDAWELTSIYMCYSQGDGFSTSLSRLLPESVVSVVSFYCVWLCSVVRLCATQDDVNKDYVCTPTKIMCVNRPPHLRPFRTYPKL